MSGDDTSEDVTSIDEIVRRHPPIVNPIPDPESQEEWDRIHQMPCRTCGTTIDWHWTGTLQGPLLSPAKHPASCGRGCIGGGVSPKQSEGGLSVFHTRERCGAPGCPGGKIS